MKKGKFQLSTRDLIICIAIIGLMLGHMVYLSRARPGRTRVTIRVFNGTKEEINFLRYEWDTVAQHIESHGRNSGAVAISPGGSKSFRVDLPGPVDFTLSCATPGGMVTSGPVRIDGRARSSSSFDFRVRPTGVVLSAAQGSGSKGGGQ